MPLIEIHLSVALTDEQLRSVTDTVITKFSELSKKPADKYMVNIRTNAKLTFALSTEPSGYVQMAGISGFNHEFNDAASAIFAEVLSPFVPPSRLFVTYLQRETTHWAKNGLTYASQ